MYDDDFYSNFLNSFSSTTTETEEESESSSYSPSYDTSYDTTSSYNPYSSDTYQDDYSVTPNYQEQSSYESNRVSEAPISENQSIVRQMNTPMIKKEEPAVVLTKTRQKIYLQARMKIAIAMFVTVVCALLFVSIWNFASIGKINQMIADKQITVSELQASITGLKSEYNLISDDGNMKDVASNSGYVDSTDSNTTILNVGEVYSEPVVEELPSNWFNDVCDFFSNLFAA